ncbi:AAA ATPase-like protein [Rubrivivax sp. A210]|nr:AAA ATPase-like protein [Rubrivivax sp. A210]
MEVLLADEPLQEQAHRDAMRLHAAAGRREAALAQYERCRALLAAELGLAPMAETTALADGLRAPAAAPAALAITASVTRWPTELPLVGRDGELAALQTAWQQGRTLLLEGVAGIGKSRLARDFAAAQGPYALAQCRRSDAGLPYASFARLLRRLAGARLSRANLADAGIAGWALDTLALLLPELDPRPAARASLQAPDQQRLVMEACAAAWLALAQDSFDTVIVDDWHWCDAASRAVLSLVAERRAESGPARTPGARELLTLRPELDAAALAARQALVDGGALHLRLPALGSAQVHDLVRRISGAADPLRFARHLEGATGGNPFFVVETLRHWQGLQLLSVDSRGVWQTPFDDGTRDYAELPVPASVREAVLARVQRLPEAAQRLLEAAALASEPFAPALLAGACALSEVEALGAIEDAVAAQLLRERDSGYAFAHDLVQVALDSHLGAERRRLVHRRLALGAQAARLPPAQVAQHWEAGGEPRRAVAYRIDAAEAAARLSSHEAALAHWQAALDDGPTLAEHGRVLQRRWPVQRGRGDAAALAAAVADFDALARQAGQQAQPGVALKAALEAASICSISHRAAEALQRVDACLAQPALPALDQARAMEVRSLALSSLGRTDEAAQLAREALNRFAGSPELDPMQQLRLRHQLMFNHYMRGDGPAALREAQALLPLAEALGARHLVAKAHCNIGAMRGLCGDLEGAQAAFQTALTQARELRLVDQQREALHGLADMDLHQGQAARALQRARESVALAPHFSRLGNEVGIGAMASQALCFLGELGAARDEAERLFALACGVDEPALLADLVSMVLDLYTLVGDEAGADRLISSVLARELAGVAQYTVKLAFNLVLNATQRGQAALARRHFALIGPPSSVTQPIDRQGVALAQAQIALCEAQPAAALQALAPCLGGVPHAHTWALVCAAWLAATRGLGPIPAAALAAADAALSSPATPALTRLLLRRERLAGAAGAGGALAARLREEQRADVARLAPRLQAWPALQQGFERRWQPALP